MRYRVSISEIVYTDYFVEAESPEEARKLVGDQSWRARCEDWADGGYGDDAEIVAVEEMKPSRFPYPMEEDGDPS